MSIYSCQFMRFQFLHFNSFMSIHVFQLIHFNSFMSILSFQFIHDNSFVSIHAVQFLHVNWFMSIHFISFHFISFQLTMNSYKPYLFIETSAPARSGHYLVSYNDEWSRIVNNVVKKCHKPSRSHQQFYRCYVYHSQSWLVSWKLG